MRVTNWKAQATYALVVGSMAAAMIVVAGIGFAAVAFDATDLTAPQTATVTKATSAKMAKLAQI